jgi:4'-phosphopantetheinyl transferase
MPSSTNVDEFQSLLSSAHAWRVCPEAIPPEALERQCLAWLTSPERARHERYRTAALRHAHLVARALCRAVLSHYTGVDPADWRFTHNAHGKPAIASPADFQSLHFNLTGTAGLVACLISRVGEVGIDAEETSADIDIDQVAQFFSPAERAFLAASPEPRTARFYEQWVLKEAWLKGIGTGLSRSPEQFTIQRDPLGHPLPLDQWQLTLHQPTPRHIAATAIDTRGSALPIAIVWRNADALLGGAMPETNVGDAITSSDSTTSSGRGPWSQPS